MELKNEIHIRVELKERRGKRLKEQMRMSSKGAGREWERGENVFKCNRTDANLLISKKQRKASAHPWPCKAYSQSPGGGLVFPFCQISALPSASAWRNTKIGILQQQ